jgi:hypothetical protein
MRPDAGRPSSELDLHPLPASARHGVLVGVLLGRHAVAPRSRVLALTVLLVPLAIVWLGVDH